MAGRKTVVFASTILAYISGATAQTFGAQMTVEESLVEFVNTITTFQVETAGEVLLFIIMPIIGFYFLIKNFTSMGYETFEERIGRHDYHNTDDDIPTGMKGFSLVAATTTVLTIGAISSGLLALAGLAALALATIIYTGLIPERQASAAETAPEPEPQPQPEPEPSQEQNVEPYRALGEELARTGREIGEGYSQRQQQRQIQGLNAALQHFDSDFISELESAHSHLGSIDNNLRNAEQDITNNEKAFDSFQGVKDRAESLNTVFGAFIQVSEQRDDPENTGLNFSGSELEQYFNNLKNNDRNPLPELRTLNAQLKSIISNDPALRARDDFKHVMEDVPHVLRVIAFIKENPYDIDHLISDDEKLLEVIQEASDRGVHTSRGDLNTDVNEFRNVLAGIRGDIPKFEDRLKRLESLLKRDFKLDESEINKLSQLLKLTGEIHTRLERLGTLSTAYANGSNMSSYIDSCIDQINDMQNEINILESHISSAEKYESKLYQQVKDLEKKLP